MNILDAAVLDVARRFDKGELTNTAAFRQLVILHNRNFFKASLSFQKMYTNASKHFDL